jgi:hypothetical protein
LTKSLGAPSNWEEDYLGKVRLMEILNLLYNIPIDEKVMRELLSQSNSKLKYQNYLDFSFDIHLTFGF